MIWLLLTASLAIHVSANACCNAGSAECAGVFAACVCTFDPYCCETSWDFQCVKEAKQGCQLDCTASCAPAVPDLASFQSVVYSPAERQLIDSQEVQANVTKLLASKGEYSIHWNLNALMPSDVSIECASMIGVAEDVIHVLLQKIACCESNITTLLDTKLLAARMILAIGQARFAEFLFAVTVPLTRYPDNAHLEAALRSVVTWVISEANLGWAGFMLCLKEMLSSEQFVVMGVAGVQWLSEGPPFISGGMIRNFGSSAQRVTDNGACQIHHRDLSKADLAVYLKPFYDNEVTDKNMGFDQIVSYAHVRFSRASNFSAASSPPQVPQSRDAACEAAIIEMVEALITTLFTFVGVEGDEVKEGIKSGVQEFRGGLSTAIKWVQEFGKPLVKDVSFVHKLKEFFAKLWDVFSLYTIWDSIKSKMSDWDIALDVVTVLATIASWFVSGGASFAIDLMLMAITFIGDIMAGIDVIESCAIDEIFPTPSPTPAPGLPPNTYCPSQDNDSCQNDECYRTERHGDYLCCPDDTYFCYPFTSGDCESGFHYCKGYLGH
jgi:hypothetical protein